MPLKLNVGVSKKIGQPDYGSLGASCNVEVELDQGLLTEDLDGLNARIRQAYVACSQAVTDELSRHQAGGRESASQDLTEGPARDTSGGNGRKTPSNGRNGQSASPKQLEYIDQLARQIKGLGTRRLETLAEKMFDKPITELTSMDASGLIDTLKAVKEGRLQLGDALNGAPA